MENEDQFNRVLNAINRGTRGVPEEALTYNTEEYWKCARIIVEPNLDADDSEAYHEYMESNMDRWVAWISSNFGSDWGKIAELVNENGY